MSFVLLRNARYRSGEALGGDWIASSVEGIEHGLHKRVVDADRHLLHALISTSLAS